MEVLVALALLAVMATALVSTTALGIRVLRATETLDETSAELALRLRLRDWLGKAARPSLLAGFPTGVSGDALNMTFTTIAPTPFAPDAAAMQISVRLAEDITLNVGLLDDEGGVIRTYDRLLAMGTSNARISYYDAAGEEPGWRDAWEGGGKLPALVRITADAGSLPEWPEFTVRLIYQ